MRVAAVRLPNVPSHTSRATREKRVLTQSSDGREMCVRLCVRVFAREFAHIAQNQIKPTSLECNFRMECILFVNLLCVCVCIYLLCSYFIRWWFLGVRTSDFCCCVWESVYVLCNGRTFKCVSCIRCFIFMIIIAFVYYLLLRRVCVCVCHRL